MLCTATKADRPVLCAQGWMSPTPVLCVVIVPFALAAASYAAAGDEGNVTCARRAVRQVLLLAAGVYLMSPLLQTLTSSVSRYDQNKRVRGLTLVPFHAPTV